MKAINREQTNNKDFIGKIDNTIQTTPEDGYFAGMTDGVQDLFDFAKKYMQRFDIGKLISKDKWGSRRYTQIQSILKKVLFPPKNKTPLAPTPPKSKLQLYDDLTSDVKGKKFLPSDFAMVASTETVRMKVVYQLLKWQEAGLKYVKLKNNATSVARKTVGKKDKLFNNREFKIGYLLSKQGEKDRIPLHPYCFLKGTLITFKKGYKKIEDIEIGDIVKTHKGNFKKVLGLSKRFHIGWLYKYKTIEATYNHPILFRGLWVEIKKLTNKRRFFIGYVYNFEVEKDNSYIANGIKVHNCKCRYVISMKGVGQ